MDPKMIEKRRLIRLKAKPKLPRKNLYLWRPSEEFEDYSDLKTESSVSETKQTASEENKKNKQKKLKRSKKSRKISKNSEKSIKSSKNPKLDSSSPKISSKFSEKQISQEINISEKAHFEAQTVKAKPFIGPMPLVAADSKIKGYGCGLYHGEGEAIASFVQKGIRIPRRGEIGLTSNEIQKFENLGYVMSGSRSF